MGEAQNATMPNKAITIDAALRYITLPNKKKTQNQMSAVQLLMKNVVYL